MGRISGCRPVRSDFQIDWHTMIAQVQCRCESIQGAGLKRESGFQALRGFLFSAEFRVSNDRSSWATLMPPEWFYFNPRFFFRKPRKHGDDRNYFFPRAHPPHRANRKTCSVSLIGRHRQIDPAAQKPRLTDNGSSWRLAVSIDWRSRFGGGPAGEVFAARAGAPVAIRDANVSLKTSEY